MCFARIRPDDPIEKGNQWRATKKHRQSRARDSTLRRTFLRLILIGVALVAVVGTFAYLGGWFSRMI